MAADRRRPGPESGNAGDGLRRGPGRLDAQPTWSFAGFLSAAPPDTDGQLVITRVLRAAGRPGYDVYNRLALGRRWMTHRRRREPPFLVYSMGKVGSTTVTAALRAARPEAPVLHVHTLAPSALARETADLRSQFAARGAVHGHLLDSLFVRARLDAGPTTDWRVVTLTRDPMSRNVSAYFQQLQARVDLELARRFRAGDSGVLDEMLNHFTRSDQGRPARWFDDELAAVFGIDVLADGFPAGRGHAVYETERATVLVIRLEDLTGAAEVAFDQAFGVRGLDVGRRQVSTAKPYADLYRAFVDRVVIPPAVLDEVYGSRYCTTFYTADEIARFRARWER